MTKECVLNILSFKMILFGDAVVVFFIDFNNSFCSFVVIELLTFVICKRKSPLTHEHMMHVGNKIESFWYVDSVAPDRSD